MFRFDNIEIIQSSFTDVDLPTKVDVIVLTPLHWDGSQKGISKFFGNAKTNE